MLLITDDFWFHGGMDDERTAEGGWGWLHVSITLLVVALLASAFVPAFNVTAKKATMAETAGNAKQLAIALRIYAGDHNGKYPDSHESKPSTANEAFRLLIREGVLEDERIFGAKLSPFVPDNNVGIAPDFLEAVKPGENHWAMTKGLSDSSPPMTPLVFENPASTGWPPKWNIAAAGKAVRGRTWKNGRIIVGFNDTSVQPLELDSAGAAISPKPEASGKDAFTSAAPTGSILDIEP